MKIADVMTRDVRVIQPDRTVRDAARLMDELNVGVLPVCDGRRLVGMITDRDIALRSTAAGIPPDRHHVRDIMSGEVEWCFDDDDLDEIVEIMSRRQIRRIPVVDRGKRLVGIVALGDLATDQEQAASRALHAVSAPSEPNRTGTRADADRGREPASRRAEFRFRDEDDVRAAFGSSGYPGEERVRNAQMRGGYGGEGYRSYGEDYAGHSSGRFGAATVTGWREHPGDDSTPEDRDAQRLERTYSLVNEPRDHRNYGVGPGDTRFSSDATASFGEVRRGEHRGRGPRNYQRSDDRIREDVNERLTDDPMLDASEIEVTVRNREVTLTGSVRDRYEKRRAEDMAESVPGVTHVQNDLRVGQHQPGHPTGTEIGDSGAATGNPGIGKAGMTAGSPSSGRATGGRAGRQRQRT